METAFERTENEMVKMAKSQCIGVVVEKCVEYFDEPNGTSMKVKHTFNSNTIDEDKHIKESNLRIRTTTKSNEEAISLSDFSNNKTLLSIANQ